VTLPLLSGFTVGITADRRWEEQAELLRRRGATILHGPSIRTLPLGPEEELRTATEAVILDPPDVLIANTGIGMRTWFGSADSWGIGEALHGALSEAAIFARGPKAAGSIHQAGLPVTARAESERLADVVRLAIEAGVEGKRVAFQRHGDDAPEAIAALRAAGAIVSSIPIYEWKLPDDTRPAQRLIEAVVAGKVHAVTFTAAPAVRNLAKIADEIGMRDVVFAALNGPVVTACVGPVCADEARRHGIADPLVPTKSRLGPMIRDLGDALGSQGIVVELGAHVLRIQGLVVSVDGAPIPLSDREAAVIAMLASRPGVVVTKEDLLQRVWGAEADDTHVVEVTVGRLRRRLGGIGTSIRAVPRRGYRFEVVAVSSASARVG
jgi:uroporphyrinogen-III synthase